jgi:AcrR family transcriptional regulator
VLGDGRGPDRCGEPAADVQPQKVRVPWSTGIGPRQPLTVTVTPATLMQVLAKRRPDGRELRAVRTRERIRNAALDLFEQRGIESVTVDEIAAAAGVSRRSFFHHFPTKEDAALIPIDRGGMLLRTAAGAPSRRSPTFTDAVIDHTLAALVELVTATPDATSLAWRSAHLAAREPRLRQRVAGLMLVWEQILGEALSDVTTDGDPLSRQIAIATVVAANPRLPARRRRR